MLGRDGWFLLGALGAGRCVVVVDGWQGGSGGDWLSPPGVLGGVRHGVVGGSACCSRGGGGGGWPEPPSSHVSQMVPTKGEENF